MSIEEDGYRISKPNRRHVQETDKDIEIKHPFKLVEHKHDSKFLQKRRHNLEQKALKSK